MLRTTMKVTFFDKQGTSIADWPGYDATRILRPAFNLGGQLFSGSITSNESMYYWNQPYTVHVDFFTIDTTEVYQLVKDQLVTGKTYPIHIGQKIIGQAELLTFTYDNP